MSNYLVRSGSKGAVGMETTNGLGVFGWALFGPHANEIRYGEAGVEIGSSIADFVEYY